MSTMRHLLRHLLGFAGGPCFSLHMSTTSNSETLSLMLMLMPWVGYHMLWSHLRPTILLVILLMEHLCDSPVTAYDIQAATQKDPLLSKVLQYVSRGWPENNMGGADLSPFFTRRTELSLQGGCILWGSRVIVPFRHRKAVLEELHEAHPGMTWMKSLARMFVWWPGIDRDTERTVQLCRECQTSLSSPPFNHGSGLPTLGPDYILTMLGQCMARCASSSLMCTRNGLKQGCSLGNFSCYHWTIPQFIRSLWTSSSVVAVNASYFIS